MLTMNDRISGNQLQKLIFLGAFGMGTLYLPRRAAALLGGGGWLAVIALTAFALVGAALCLAAAERHLTGDSFVADLRRLITAPFAYVCAVLFCLTLIFCAGMELRLFAVITRGVLLRNTPGFITAGSMALVCAYAAAKGIETRARAGELLLPVMALVLAALIIFAALDADYSKLLPVSQSTGSVYTLPGCVPILLPCLLLSRKTAGRKRKPLTAVALAGIVCALITAACIAKFGGSGTAAIDYPVLRLMDVVRFPGSFIERQDAIMFSFWIIAMFAVCNCYFYYGAALVKDIIKKPTHKASVIICALGSLLIAALPLDQADIEQWLNIVHITAGFFFLFVLPLVLLAVGFLKKNNRKAAPAALMLAFLFLLTGCYDSVPIENRAFVTAIAIDKAASPLCFRNSPPPRFIVSLVFPASDGEAGEASETETIYVSSFDDVPAMLDIENEKEVYPGQAKVLLIGEGLLNDERLLAEAVTALDRHPDVNRQMVAVATDIDITDGAELNAQASFLLKWFKQKEAKKKAPYSVSFTELYEAVKAKAKPTF
jgi:spore germination protein